MTRILLKRTTVVFALIASGLGSSAQTLKEFFASSETPCLYLGIDYTKNKFIDYSTANTSDIRDREYNSINDLIVNEPKKYELDKAFHKSRVDHDLGLTAAKNSKSNTEDMLSSSSADFHRLKESDIDALVKTYDFKGKKGIGILIVAEACSKAEKAMAAWVTFIDMNTKKVLLTDRMEGKQSMGFGFRNVWATPVKSILEKIQKTKYNEWKTKVGA